VVQERTRPARVPKWQTAGFRLFSLEALVVAALVATALALFYRDALTRETLTIDAAAAGKAFQSYAFDDRAEGGKSQASIKGPLDWTCVLTDDYRYRYCGFGLIASGRQGQGIDLSRFETLKVNIDYRGRGEFLRLVLKNRDARYGQSEKAAVDKPNQATITVESAEQTIPLQLSDFTVAEWWKDLTRLPPQLSRPQFDNITAIEFVTGQDAYAGEHHIRVRALTFERQIVGTETWYSAILAGWVMLIGGVLWQRRRHALGDKRRLARELRTTLDSIPQMVWTYESDGRIHFNRRWEDFTGIAIGRDPAVNPWDLLHPDDRRMVIAGWSDTLRSGEPYELEYRVRHRSGEYRWVLAQALPHRGKDDAVTWYGSCTDVHDRVLAELALKNSINSERRKSRELKWASEHDSLTGLPNRRAFQSRLRAATLRAMESNGQLGLLLIDIDHFKHVNDSFGHIAGDDLLKNVARRLGNAVREGDFVARIGGDEFAILLESIDSPDDLLAVGNTAFAAIQSPLKLCRRVMSAGASIGGAQFPRDGVSANDLFKSADTALYALKSSGRGGTLLFHAHMLEQAEKAASQLAFARDAVTDASIIPFYQAKVAIDTGAIAGFEALLRWQHPTDGLQLPDTLEEAFKDYELAARIGELMQRKVADDIRCWLDRGIPVGRVSINASPAEFLRDDYAERLLAVLADRKVPPAAIEVEVTEHAFMERGRDFVARALAELQRAGVSVSLDDFGTGYSSLAHLRDFPVDRVKIDKSFIQQMTEDAEIAAIVAAVVNLARSLQIDVVAEGVETRSQLDLLRSMGCHLVQGHLFWAALPPSSVPTISLQQQAAA